MSRAIKPWPAWLRLRPRFVLGVLVGVAILTSAMAVAGYLQAREALIAASQDHLRSLTQAKAGELDLRLVQVAAAPRGLAATLLATGFPEPARLAAALEQHLLDRPDVFGMALAFAPGAYPPGPRLFAPYVFRTPQGFKLVPLEKESYDYLERDWFQVPARQGRPLWSEPYFDDGGGDVLMTTYSHPVLAKGSLVAVATADLALDWLRQALEGAAGDGEGYALLLTGRGTFLAAPDPAWLLKDTVFTLAERRKLPELAELGRRMTRGEPLIERIKDPWRGEYAWLAAAPVRETGWTLAVVVPQREVLAPAVALARQQLIWEAVGLVAMAGVVLLLVMGLTRPLKRLTSGARRLAAGELDARVEGVRPGDEVGEMAEAFNRMASDLTHRMAELKTKQRELEAALQKVELLESIEGHLSKFVPQSVRELIAQSPESPDLLKRPRDVSVLFLDVAGYTRMSENVAGGRMNFLIECYFSAFLDAIYENHGDINETAGDGLMIIFQGEDEKTHAVGAVKTALAIKRKVAEVNDDLEGTFEPVTIDIGINSGKAMVGSSCFEGVAGDRWTFTASGPVTNLAARIGALATEGRIFVGEETARRVVGEFRLESLGLHSLKNVAEPVNVFEVLGELEAGEGGGPEMIRPSAG